LFTTLARWVRRPLPAVPRAAGLDAPAALEALNGDAALYRRLLKMFRERETNFEACMREAWQRGDAGTALRRAHDLKSVAGTLGMAPLQQAAAALEAACGQEAAGADIEPLLQAVTGLLMPLLQDLPAVLNE